MTCLLDQSIFFQAIYKHICRNTSCRSDDPAMDSRKISVICFCFFFFHLQLRIRKSQLGWLSHAADSFSTCHILQVQDWTFYYVQGYSLIWQTSHTLHKNVSETHLEIWLILTLAMLRNEILLGFPRYLWEALNIAHLKIYLKFCWEAGDEFTPGKVAFW